MFWLVSESTYANDDRFVTMTNCVIASFNNGQQHRSEYI